MGRVIRILATISMARALDFEAFGLLAIALTVHELVAVLANNGFGLYLLKSSTKSDAALTNTVYLLSWLWALGMSSIQALLALILLEMGYNQVGMFVLTLAPLHLFLPLGITHLYLLQKENRLGVVAGMSTLQSIAESLSIIVLLFIGLGIWGVIAAKLIATLLWALGIRLSYDWRFHRQFGFVDFRKLFRFTIPVLLSEFGRSTRMWGDNLVVGGLLGADLLGIYYFAKNSGLGISLGLSQAGVNAITPKLAEISRTKNIPNSREEQQRVVLSVSAILSVIVLAQALLAPFYIPIVFGAQWLVALPVLTLLCFSAIPRCIADIHACLARTSGMTRFEAQWNTIFTLAYLLSIAIGSFFWSNRTGNWRNYR